MNKVMLIGNVGNEPDVRYYDADQAVAQFRLATTERAYTLQGDKLYIEGRLRYRVYDDQKGMRRFVTEIYGENMEILSSRTASVSTEQKTSPAPDGKTDSQTDDLPF